jgi:hypothetical protein
VVEEVVFWVSSEFIDSRVFDGSMFGFFERIDR